MSTVFVCAVFWYEILLRYSRTEHFQIVHCTVGNSSVFLLLGVTVRVTRLTQSNFESQAVVQAVSGGEHPVLIDQDASAVELASGVQQERLHARTPTFMICLSWSCSETWRERRVSHTERRCSCGNTQITDQGCRGRR